MKIALVGAHGSPFDLNVYLDAVAMVPEWVSNQKGQDLEFVDLRLGRDFLKEKKEYDIVVLFYIFVATEEEHRQDVAYFLTKHIPDYKTSPIHSPINWRNRLLATKAKEILVFGFSPKSEVTGDYIGEIPGYRKDVIAKPEGSVWRYRHDFSRQS